MSPPLHDEYDEDVVHDTLWYVIDTYPTRTTEQCTYLRQTLHDLFRMWNIGTNFTLMIQVFTACSQAFAEGEGPVLDELLVTMLHYFPANSTSCCYKSLAMDMYMSYPMRMQFVPTLRPHLRRQFNESQSEQLPQHLEAFIERVNYYS